MFSNTVESENDFTFEITTRQRQRFEQAKTIEYIHKCLNNEHVYIINYLLIIHN